MGLNFRYLIPLLCMLKSVVASDCKISLLFDSEWWFWWCAVLSCPIIIWSSWILIERSKRASWCHTSGIEIILGHTWKNWFNKISTTPGLVLGSMWVVFSNTAQDVSTQLDTIDASDALLSFSNWCWSMWCFAYYESYNELRSSIFFWLICILNYICVQSW